MEVGKITSHLLKLLQVLNYPLIFTVKYYYRRKLVK